MEVLRKPQLDKLRWYQYSLKSLFLFSIFFAVCVSILTIWIEFRSHGKISLITAAKNGDLKEVKWLLDHGADINASVCHDTALIFASGAGQIKVVKYLVSQGADINAGKDHGRSALVQAICNHHPDIAVWLIQQGADVNARDENKDMPLHYTAHYGNAFITKCLLEKELISMPEEAAAARPCMRPSVIAAGMISPWQKFCSIMAQTQTFAVKTIVASAPATAK